MTTGKQYQALTQEEQKKKRQEAVRAKMATGKLIRGETKDSPVVPVDTPTVVQRAGRATIFDPRRRGGTGLGGVAGSAKSPLEAATLKEATELINAQTKITPAVPKRDGTEEPAVVPELKIITPEDDIAEINRLAQEKIEKIKDEPTVLALQQAEIAQVSRQAQSEIDAIEYEEKARKAEQAKLGEEYKEDKFLAKQKAVRGIMAKQDVDINVAEGIYNKQVAERSKLDPQQKESYDRIISRYSDESFDTNNAYNVAIEEYEKDGVDSDDMQKAHDAVASRYGKNFADEKEDEYLINVRKIDKAIVENDRKLIDTRKIGATIKKGEAGARVTNAYLKTIFGINQSLVPDAVGRILASNATDDAKRQASAFSADFYSDVETGIGRPKEKADIRTIGKKLIRIDPETGEAKVIYSAPVYIGSAVKTKKATGKTGVTVGKDGAFPDLSAKDVSEAQNLAVQRYGQRAGSKPEFLNPILQRISEGETIDNIRDSLEYSDVSQSFVGDFKDAFEFSASGLPASRREASKDNLDRLLERGDTGEARDFVLKISRDAAPVEERKQANGREDAIKSLNAIEIALNKYVGANGDTGLISGNIEKLRENVLRSTGNEELARLAGEIKVAVQSYRKSVTGAAFTPEEAKEYASVYPDIANTPELNKAKIDGMRTIFSRNQRNFYERAMGSQNYENLFERKVEPSISQEEVFAETDFSSALTELQGIFPDREITDEEILEFLTTKE